jgi:general secretion pathway protein I
MRSRAGFTLIEVLVALIIVAAGVAAVMSALVTGASSTMRLRDRTFAEWVAADRITETRLQRDFPSIGRTEGETSQAGRLWVWQQQVERTAIEGVVQIVVSVRSKGDPGTGWLVTLRGARGANVAHTDTADALWDTAARSTP